MDWVGLGWVGSAKSCVGLVFENWTRGHVWARPSFYRRRNCRLSQDINRSPEREQFLDPNITLSSLAQSTGWVWVGSCQQSRGLGWGLHPADLGACVTGAGSQER